MLHELALEDPNLDADDAVGGLGQAVAEIDVGAQRVQRHAAFAVPLRTRDFRAAETAGDVDTDADSAGAQCRLNRALHGAAECNAALELLGDVLSDQHGVGVGLAHFEEVQVNFRLRVARELAAQLLDVGALLADENAGARRVHGDAALLVRTLDDDLRDAGRALQLQDVSANGAIFMQELAVLATTGEPAAVPGAVDAEHEDRSD